MIPRAALTALLLCSAGCGLSLGASSELGPTNTCGSSSDCAAGATCVADRCVATRYDLSGLLMEVRLSAASGFGAGSDNVIDPGAAGVRLVSTGSAGQPFDVHFDVPLPAPVSLKGARVVLNKTTVLGPGCNFPDGSVPAQITFYRVPRFAGLPFDPVNATTTNVGSDKSPSYAFDVDLVSSELDRYDVYIVPDLGSGCATSVPPYFLRSQVIAGQVIDGQNIDANKTFQLPPIGTLKATLHGLTSADVASWRVDLLEPDRGLPISSGNQIEPPGSTSATVTAQISTLDPSAWPILRLTPVDPTQPDPKPLDPSRPTAYFSLHGAVVGGTKDSPEVDFDVSDLLGAPVPVEGRILGSDGITGVPSRLTIQSQSLQGTTPTATYSTDSVITDGSGAFAVNLPPGTYWVRSFPITDSALSITDHTLDWPSNPDANGCVCGVSFTLDGKADLAGAVTTPAGEPLASAFVGVTPSTSVNVTPSQSETSTYLYNALSLRPLPARSESTTTDGDGAFSLLVDLGTVDLSVQPDPASNLPWLVHPSISPAAARQDPDVALPNAAFLSGTVTDSQGRPVPSADVVAWYPVRDATDPTVLTGTVVKIAATTTDANGLYRLVLPAFVAGQPSNVGP